MVELRVADWPVAVAWYVGTLGMRVVLRDEPNGFALLEAPDGGRIALKAGEPTGGGPRLVFRVDDLDAVCARLAAAGVAVTEPVADDREPYRSSRLVDPAGTLITLFAWTDR